MIGPREEILRGLFRASLWLKGAHSLFELVVGFLLHILPNEAFTAMVRRLTWAELMEGPGDLVANALRQAKRIVPLGLGLCPMNPGIARRGNGSRNDGRRPGK
jgi:uncharacterized membrane protein